MRLIGEHTTKSGKRFQLREDQGAYLLFSLRGPVSRSGAVCPWWAYHGCWEHLKSDAEALALFQRHCQAATVGIAHSAFYEK